MLDGPVTDFLAELEVLDGPVSFRANDNDHATKAVARAPRLVPFASILKSIR